jgi:uncharacterized membrane protein YphA (DoxX/SURF4 family)
MKKILHQYINFIKKYTPDVALLGARILLVIGFIGPAMMKLKDINAAAQWFKYMKIPLPTLNAYLATATEVTGVILIAVGLATEFISLPLIIVMLVAIITVHMGNGWLAIASSENIEVAERLGKAKEILVEHSNYEWLTAKGSFVILNNGVEFPVIYIVLLLVLMAFGPGKFSIDYFLKRNRK